ncbi:hypothetical protein K504DRAFT_92606 [Pleomassaria siparia CBS 279.74]|uniref:Uncharacterized protein n=1 Tax=Pleomassaria siparia CBS 279.74 TaxID=1314801 RepID=A0A6G1JY78_9PLEO|nr:hypothetical protein K504DRAFT_92606 [Pleomassaria siparia CBS 279.74]
MTRFNMSSLTESVLSISKILCGALLCGGGLALLQNRASIEPLTHFPRERIPERLLSICAQLSWNTKKTRSSLTILAVVWAERRPLCRRRPSASLSGLQDYFPRFVQVYLY